MTNEYSSPLASFFRGYVDPFPNIFSLEQRSDLQTALIQMGAVVVDRSSNYTSAYSSCKRMSFARGMIYNLRASEELAESEKFRSGSIHFIRLMMIKDVLECGQLSMAVLQRSESLVKSRLRDPAVIDEKNALGQSPLHLCGDWAKGIELLLDAGFPLGVIDQWHLTPLDYAISMNDGEDAVRKLLEAGCPLRCCKRPHKQHGMFHGCISTLYFAFFSIKIRDLDSLSQWPLPPRIAYLIQDIKLRRENLALLAGAYLPQDIVGKVQSLGTVMDDTRAQSTWSLLESAAVNIPSSLDTHSISVYHHVVSKDLAIYLYDLGFKNLDEYDQYGRTPLMSLACSSMRHLYDRSLQLELMKAALDLAEWFLLQGANPLRPLRDHGGNVLYIAAFNEDIKIRHTIGITERAYRRLWIDPVVFKLSQYPNSDFYYAQTISPLVLPFVQELTLTCHDSCCRGCSLGGCTPTTAFLKRMRTKLPNSCSRDLYELSCFLYNWYNIVATAGVSSSDVRKEVERFVAFSKLDLTHTCCRMYISPEVNSFAVRIPSDEDIDEVQEEEEELLHHLENMLQDLDSDWWKSSSSYDILLDISGERPPPTLKWATEWLLYQKYGLDEEDIEEIRTVGGYDEEFWEQNWDIYEDGHGLELFPYSKKYGIRRNTISIFRERPDGNWKRRQW